MHGRVTDDGIGARGTVAYQPAIDGLRALAVVAVLLYHADVSHASGGFLGVDIFFVISGFLITTLLLAEHTRTGRIDIRSFYLRRARRLLPALLCVIAFVAIYAALWAQPPDRGPLRGDGFAAMFYFANWRFVFENVSYFAQSSASSPLLHTWSLAIEEQWYLVWPAVFLAATRLRARQMRAVLLGGSVVLAAASAWQMAHLYRPGADPSRVYYGTDTRAQALLVGVVLAFVLSARRPASDRANRAVGVAGLGAAALLLALITTATDRASWLYRGGFLLVAIAAAVALWAALVPGPLRWVLSRRPLTALGKISYGIYLWHWPLIVLLTPRRVHCDGLALLGVRVSATLAAATASYLIVERPIRRSGFAWIRGRGARLLRPAVAGASALAIGTGLFVATADAPTWTQYLTGQSNSVLASAALPVPHIATPAPTRVSATLRRPRVLMLGDSTAFTLLYFTSRAHSPVDWSDDVRIGCGIVPLAITNDPPIPKCANVVSEWEHDAARADPDLVVLDVGAWEIEDHYQNGKFLPEKSTQYRAYLGQILDNAINTFSRRGAHVAIMKVPCYTPGNYDFGGRIRSDVSRQRVLDLTYEIAAQRHPGVVSLVPWDGVLCQNGHYIESTNGVVLRPDGEHFSAKGAPIVWSKIEPPIDALAIAARDARTHA